MNLAQSVRRFSAAMAASALVALASPAGAQEIADSHLQAARSALAAIDATDGYDNILPQAAYALKQQLIQQNPNLQALIDTTVDEKAIALAGRRADLEREAALAYARVFTEADLNAIATFYNGEPGKKLIAQGPLVTREVTKAAEIWQRGIARDLAQQVGEQLQQVVGAQVQPAPEGETPAAPAEPAPAQ
jgi:uncharacterized protein